MATRTWDGGGTTDNWSDTGNWGGAAAPVTGDDVVFAGSTRLTPNNNGANGLALNSITFAAAAGAFTVSGANLAATPITNNSSNTQTLSNQFDGTMTVTTSSGGNIVLSGAVNGFVTKAGLGDLTFSGAADNVGSGATVNAGTLILAKTSSGAPDVHAIGGNTLTINSGGTVKLGGTGGDQLYNDADVVVNSGGTFDVNGLSESIDSLSGAGTVTNTGGGTPVLTVGQNNASMTFSGVIANASGSLSLVKAGSGTLQLGIDDVALSMTYSGGTTISGGTLMGSAQNNSVFGTGAITIGSGTTLWLNRQAITNNIVNNGGQITLDNGFGSSVSGTITNNALLTVEVNYATQVLSGVISGSGGITVTDTLASGGLLKLTASNTYTGATTISSGGVLAGGGRPLGFSAVTVASGASLTSSGFTGLAAAYYDRPGAPSTADHNDIVAFLTHLSGLAMARGDKPISMNFGETGGSFPAPYNSSMTYVESVYSGRFTVPTTGTYTFNTRSDDGSMLWVDGVQVVNNNFYQGMTTRTGTIALVAGQVYTLTISFYEGAGGYGLNAQISGVNDVVMVDINTTNVSITPDIYIESLAGAGSVVLTSGNLTVGNSSSTTFSGVISGAGNVIKFGSGTLTLTGVNTFTGTLFIAAGTVSVGNGTTDGSIASAANVANYGALVWNLVGARTYSGVISGTGSLTKSGAGTLTLTRQNTYTGATTVTLGTLKLRNSWRYLRFTPTAWVGVDVQQIADLQFFLADVWTAATTITNPGGSNPVGEEPYRANDNNSGTKWLDDNKGPLVYDFATQVLFDEYNWATANDAPARDPLRWKVEGSHDNSAWTMLDDRTGADQAVSANRQTWVAPIFSQFYGWPLGNGTNVLPTGTALTVSLNATLDIGGLAQTVASASFAAGSTLQVDLNTGPATKTGKLTVTGTATVAGRVAVGLNTLPVSATAYTVLSAATLSGTFQAVSTDLTLGGRTYAISYPSNTVVLTDGGNPRTMFLSFS